MITLQSIPINQPRSLFLINLFDNLLCQLARCNIRPGIKNIAIFLFLVSTFTSFTYPYHLHFKQEKPLREILEDFRKSSGINFVYSDNTIESLNIELKMIEDLSLEKIEYLLAGKNLQIQKFDDRTYVIYKKAEVKQTERYEQVITAQEIEESDSLQMMIKPILISNPVPPYPRKAARNKIEGSVRIKFLINENGIVTQSEVLATSGYSILDSAAKEFVYSLKYAPAEKDGEPHSAWASMLFRYMLTGKNIN